MTGSIETKFKARSLLNEGRLAEAKVAFMEVYSEHPNDSDVLVGLGILHARAGDFGNAEQWMQKAIAANPHNAGNYIHMGNILIRSQRFAEAIANYQMAISKQPDIFEAHFYLAGLLMVEKQLEDAEYHFKYALRIRPDHADCYASLGQVYELLHRLEDARHCAEQAVQLKSDHIGALLLLGKINRREKHYEAAAEIFTRVLTSATDDSLIATVTTELGYVLDRQGFYDEAYEAFASAKAVWSRIAAGIPFDRRTYQDHIELNMQGFNEATVAGWNKSWIPAGSKPAPVFFVGFPRSGTTLTEQILSQHPALVTSDEKPFLQQVMEAVPSLLDTSLALPDSVLNASAQDLARLRDAYWREVEADMGTLEDGVQLVDKLPLNLVDLGFIARVFPDSPVLVAIRDPRDVCLSCFMQGFQLNPAMINFLDMESTVSFYTQVMGLWLHYRAVLDIGWHQYRYEDLVDDFDTTAGRIFQFLGLTVPADAARFHVAARERLINTPSYQDVTTPIYSRSKERWRNYGKYISPYAARLAPFLQEFGYK